MSARKKQPEKLSVPHRCWNWCKEHKILSGGGILAAFLAITYSVIANVITPPVNNWLNQWMDRKQPATEQATSPDTPAELSKLPEAPILPDDYPSVAAIPNRPNENDVKPFASGEKKRIVFRYRNTTRIPLKLLVLDWQYQLFPSKEPLAKNDGWYAWDFPATNTFILNKDFSPGWYTFYVKRLDTGEKIYLTTHNISGSNRPAMEVTIGSGSKPFQADFPTLGDSDVQ
jgi:hypothetical protein